VIITKKKIDRSLMQTVCLNGVVYYHYAENKGGEYKGYGYIWPPKWNSDGTLETCNEVNIK